VTEANGSTVAYNYDALYRLTSDTRTGTNPFSGSYAYDLAGNPTSYNGTSHSYNGGDLLSTDTYDGDGNPLSGTFGGYSSTMTWNDNNDLTYIANSSANESYGYGSDGLRHWIEVGSGSKTFSIYNGDTLIGEVSATGTPVAAYTWGNDLISEHRYDTTTPTSSWYLYGPQGETRYLTNSAGTVTDSYTYSAYGELIASTGTDTNPFRYGGSVGYYSDSNTGLILCGQRWYDPAAGRWLNSDPIGYDGGSDLYAYCGDNPVYWVDPYGEKRDCSWHGTKNLFGRLGTVNTWINKGRNTTITIPIITKDGITVTASVPVKGGPVKGTITDGPVTVTTGGGPTQIIVQGGPTGPTTIPPGHPVISH
jgi:RHS repeat-associated protein